MIVKKIRWWIAQFFEKRWWINYLHKKDGVSYLEWKKNYWLNFLQKLNLSVQDIHEPIIDIGCGPAGIFILFNQFNVEALDPLLPSYRNLPVFDKSLYPLNHFIEIPFEEYEPEKQFASIFCLNAINHFIDLEKSVLKLRMISAYNARVIVSIDAHNYTLLKYFFKLLPFDILHPHQLDLMDYIKLFEKYGFRLEQKERIKKDFIFSYWALILSLPEINL